MDHGHKVRLFLDRSCLDLSSFKIVVIFNNASSDFVLISADGLFKVTTILKELRMMQLCSNNERTLSDTFLLCMVAKIKKMQAKMLLMHETENAKDLIN